MKKDLIMLLAGAILGFGASIGTIKYQEYNQSKRALSLFKIELYKIDKLLSPLTATNNQLQNSQTGKTIQFNGISTTEIPNFKMVTQIDVFLSLNDRLRKLIYDISLDLDCAENNRKLAIPLLNHIDRANELDMYGTIYLDCLRSAKRKLDNFRRWQDA